MYLKNDYYKNFIFIVIACFLGFFFVNNNHFYPCYCEGFGYKKELWKDYCGFTLMTSYLLF